MLIATLGSRLVLVLLLPGSNYAQLLENWNHANEDKKPITINYASSSTGLSTRIQHIPLARDAWSRYGLTKWSVVKLSPDTGYALQTIMTWDSPQCLGKAMQEAGAEVMGDLKNFSTEKPVVIQGVIAAGNMD